MKGSVQIARAYAEALLDLALAQDALGSVVDDLHAVQGLVDRDETFRRFFLSPRLKREHKKRVLVEALRGWIGRSVLGLLAVLVDKRREPVFDNIVDEFERFKDLREGRIHVHVTAARPLGPDQRAELAQRLALATGKLVEIHERIEPAALGGVVVKLGDKVIDGTVRRRLERLRRTLVAAGSLS